MMPRAAGLTTEDLATAAVAIWTTTPWTLPANQAVCVYPLYDYVLAEFTRAGGPECLVVAEALVSASPSASAQLAPRARQGQGTSLEGCGSNIRSTSARCR